MTQSGASVRSLAKLIELAQQIPLIRSPYPLEAPTFLEPASEGSISEIESAFQVSLPADYGSFLRVCGGFVAMDVFNGYQLFSPGMILRMRADNAVPKLVLVGGMEQPCIAVAGDGGGNLFLLLLRDAKVCKWLHETAQAVPAADSFQAFVDRIAEDWLHFIDDEREGWKYLAG